MSDGPCGGLTELEHTQPLAILATDRVRLPVPRGDAFEPGVIPGSTTGRILTVRAGGAQLFILAEEAFRSAQADEADLAAAVRRSLPGLDPSAEAWIGPLEGGAGGVLILERSGRVSDEIVHLAAGLIPGPDGYLVRVELAADPATAETGGCEQLAVRMLEGARSGRQRLYVEPGPRRLLGDVGLTLPPAHHLSMLRALSYLRLLVAPLAPLGSEPAFLEITIGEPHRTRSSAPDGATVQHATLLGQPVEWTSWQDETGLFREARLGQAPAGGVRLLVAAGSRERADELQDIAASLRSGVEPGRVRCIHRPPPSWWDAALEVPPDLSDDYLLLRDAQAVAAAGGFDPAPEREAFQRLVASLEGALVFQALARRGTAAGRLYGLAGLYVVDPAELAPALCAVRPELPDEIAAREVCGQRTRPTESWIESSAPDAIRGELHWDPLTWSMASGTGTPDLVGGGLGYVLLRRDEADVAAWALQGEGHALVPNDELPVVDLPSPTGPRQDLVLVGEQMCAARPSDGRWICFGGRDPERDPPRLLPDVIRNPRSVIRPNGATCALDADGQRICFGRLLDGPIRERAAACGQSVGEHAIGVRRFVDGPFTTLFQSDDGCGLTERGEVRCFVLQRNRMPDWVDPEGVLGFGASYPVPVPDLVGVHRGLAWTRQSVVFAMGQHRSPERIGQLPGPIRTAWGGFGPAFFQLEDGRVFGYAIERAEDGSPVYWEYDGPDDDGSAFIEIPALAGSQIAWSGQHGCARFRDGRVSCFGWNESHAIGPGDPEDRAPRDVPAFRGAQAIFPAQRYTCALFPRGTLRCYGDFAETIDPESRIRPDGSRELDLRRVLSRARER